MLKCLMIDRMKGSICVSGGYGCRVLVKDLKERMRLEKGVVWWNMMKCGMVCKLGGEEA